MSREYFKRISKYEVVTILQNAYGVKARKRLGGGSWAKEGHNDGFL